MQIWGIAAFPALVRGWNALGSSVRGSDKRNTRQEKNGLEKHKSVTN